MVDISILKLAVSLLLFILFWQIVWKDFALDLFRQRLFDIRSELFDLSRKNPDKFTFNSPAYIEFESLINGMIRFGHDFNFFRVLLFYFFDRKLKKKGFSIIDSTVEATREKVDLINDRQIERKLYHIQDQINTQIILYLIKISPLFFLVFLLILVIAFVKMIFMQFQFNLNAFYRTIKHLIMDLFSRHINGVHQQALIG